MYEKSASRSYNDKLLATTNLNWKEIYFLPKKFWDMQIFIWFSTKFQIIIFFSISYFSSLKKLHQHSALFETADETPLRIFYTCNISKWLWNKLQCFVSQCLDIPEKVSEFINIGNQHNFLLTTMHYYFSIIICTCQENMGPFVLIVWNCAW